MSQPTGQAVPNYLVPAIMSNICCCPPFGIVSVVYAAQVNAYLGSGQYEAAVAASQNAKKWTLISFAVGILLDILLALFSSAIFAAVLQLQQDLLKQGQGPGGFPVVPQPPAAPAAPR